MVKMDGRDSAENQIWEKRDIMVIKKFEFKSHEDKIANSDSSPSFNQRKKNVRGIFHLGRCSGAIFGEDFRERENFSLEYREIRPSAGFGTRRRNVLREAGYAWTPGSGVSSNSLR